MRALATMAIAVLGITHAYSQPIVHGDDVLRLETFEFNNPTTGQWSIQAQPDTACQRSSWKLTGPDSLSKSRYALYRSRGAKPGCTHFFTSGKIFIDLRSFRDTVFISVLMYRVGTPPAGDALNMYIGNTDTTLIGPMTMGAYYQSAPATDSGWQKITWAVPGTSLRIGGDYRVYFRPVTVGEANLMFDDVEVRHKWQKQNGKLEFAAEPDTVSSRKKYNVTWQYEGSSVITDAVQVDYSTDHGKIWIPVAVSDGLTNQYTWDVPAIAEDSVMLRITDPFDTSMRTVSKPFAITWPIEVLNPNGSGWLYRGLHVPIRWKARQEVNKLRISFTSDDGFHWNDLATDVSADSGQWLWTVPNISTQKGRIRISDMEDYLLFDWSDSLFGIYDGLGVRNASGTEQSITCYPNPSDGKFTLRSPVSEAATVRIIDMLGQAVYSANLPAGSTEHAIDLGPVKAGVYSVVVSSGERVLRGIVVVGR